MNRLMHHFKSGPAGMIVMLMLLVTLPHFQYIPFWSVSIIILLAIWRTLIIFNKLPLPNKYLSALLTLTLSFFVYKHSGSFSGIAAGSHLLVMMAFCKLIESRTHRDYMLLIILSFFIISTNFLFSQDIGTAFYMFFCLFIAIISLINVNRKNTQFTFSHQLKLSGQLMAYSLPVMLILFVFFPRITGPLWKTNTDETQAKTGLSDSMSPGQISKLIYSNDLVLRARFENRIPANNQLYWRAMTLWNYDGKKWSMADIADEDVTIQVTDPGFDYTVTLEPHQKNWLFLLDLPYKLNNQSPIASDFTAQTTKKVSKILQYSARSTTQYKIKHQLSNINRNIALALPNLNAKTAALAHSWQQSSLTSNEIVDKAKDYFASNSFYYTLSPPGLTRQDSIDQFLFETRRGFCEHYASAFAVLMRHAGIPSRIVLGYLGGTYNPFSNEISVDQSMAHAWTEVWIDKKGWVRVDPTASIAPERVEKNLASAIENQEDLPFHLQIDSAVIQKIRQVFDAIDSGWNQWILNYNEDNQKQFLKLLTGSELNLKDISNLFIKILLATLIITASFYLFTGLKRKPDAVTAAYKKFCNKFAKAGYKKAKHEGPRDYQLRMAQAFPAKQQSIKQIIDLYINLKYSNHGSDEKKDKLIKAIGKLNLKSK